MAQVKNKRSRPEQKAPGSPDLYARRKRILFAAAVIAFLMKLALAASSYGTNDVTTFEEMLEKLQTHGARSLYTEGTDVILDGRIVGPMQMNHPPMVLTMLRAWGALRQVTGIRLGFWIRFSCACADLLTIWIVYRLFGVASRRWMGMLLVALAPASIMISGFHGNTDPIMIAFVVLAVFMLEKRDAPWLAGVAFGLACSVKVWPLVLVPVFLLSGGTLQRRVRFSAAALGTALALALPWHEAGFTLMLQRVFNYESMTGWWGITYLIPQSHNAAKTAMVACVLGSAAYMFQRLPSLFAQCAVVTFVFLFLAPGFGPQYLAWAVPWTIAAGARSATAFHAAAGMFLFGIYTAWSAGLPWYFANAHKYLIPVMVSRVGLIAWIATSLMLADVWRRNSRTLVPKTTTKDQQPLEE